MNPANMTNINSRRDYTDTMQVEVYGNMTINNVPLFHSSINWLSGETYKLEKYLPSLYFEDYQEWQLNVEAKDGNGSIALHLACAGGHDHTAQVLLNNGADLEAKNENGSTALHRRKRRLYIR